MFRATALALLVAAALVASDSVAKDGALQPSSVPSPRPVASPSSVPQTQLAPPAPVIKSPVGFIKGYTWGWNSQRGDYLRPEAKASLAALADTGTAWMTLAYSAHMPAWNKPEIRWGDKNPAMVTDDEIRLAIKVARTHKLKVILKPVIDPPLDGKPRWAINFQTGEPRNADDAAAWKTWWANYTAYILHHAKLAQETGCELFCIGCELRSTERFETQWRDLIRQVREVYKGPLVYNGCLETMWDVKWWDAVDILGVSFYSWHPDQPDSSVDAQAAYFTKLRTGLRVLAAKTKRPIFFSEIGCRSARGAAAMSGDFTHWEWPYDGQEQARFHEAAFQVFWDEPWFCGYSWWDWKVRLYPKEKADQNKEFVIYGKPAEKVLRTWYAKERK